MTDYAVSERTQEKRGTAQQRPNLTGIPDQMKNQFEATSGISFDDVRVHYHSDRPAQMQALAYTQGNEVYIGPGQEQHLGHELGHVVQQKEGRVAPTVYHQGVAINDAPSLEHEADRLAAKASAAGTAAFHADADQESHPVHDVKGIVRQKIRIATPIQRYTTFMEGGKLYNCSCNRKAICGIEYPNHEFYINDKNDIGNLDPGKDSILGFKQDSSRKFAASGIVGDYYRILPTYKSTTMSPTPDDANKPIRMDFEKKYGKLTGIAAFVVDLSKLKMNKENVRKYITQCAHTSASANPRVLEAQVLYSKLYIELTKYIEEETKIKANTFDALEALKGNIEQSFTVPDRVKVMQPVILDSLNQMICALKVLPEIIPKRNYWESYLLEQSYYKPGEIPLPRGCDLVAGSLVGKDNTIPDRWVRTELTNPTGGINHFHFATKIFRDAADYITLEGFAKPGHEYLDNTWEFFMHGNHENNLSFNQAFEAYTKIRYRYFEDYNESLAKVNTWNPTTEGMLDTPMRYATGMIGINMKHAGSDKKK